MEVATLVFGKKGEDEETTHVQGPLRILVVPRFEDDEVTLAIQVDPFGEGGGTGVTVSVSDVLKQY